jgi:hypothetical protein
MRQKRSHRIDIRLTLPEYEKAQLMADENNLTMSELFRAKTLKTRQQLLKQTPCL